MRNTALKVRGHQHASEDIEVREGVDGMLTSLGYQTDKWMSDAMVTKESSCAICQRRVYPVEKIDIGNIYHRSCFRCNICGMQLTLKTFQLVDEPNTIIKSLRCPAHITFGGQSDSRRGYGIKSLGISSAMQAQQFTSAKGKRNSPKRGWNFNPNSPYIDSSQSATSSDQSIDISDQECPSVNYSSAEDDPATSTRGQGVHPLVSRYETIATKKTSQNRVANEQYLVATAIDDLLTQRGGGRGEGHKSSELKHTYNDYTLSDIRKYADATFTPSPPEAPLPPPYREPEVEHVVEKKNAVKWTDGEALRQAELVETFRNNERLRELRILEADKERSERFPDEFREKLALDKKTKESEENYKSINREERREVRQRNRIEREDKRKKKLNRKLFNKEQNHDDVVKVTGVRGHSESSSVTSSSNDSKLSFRCPVPVPRTSKKVAPPPSRGHSTSSRKEDLDELSAVTTSKAPIDHKNNRRLANNLLAKSLRSGKQTRRKHVQPIRTQYERSFDQSETTDDDDVVEKASSVDMTFRKVVSSRDFGVKGRDGEARIATHHGSLSGSSGSSFRGSVRGGIGSGGRFNSEDNIGVRGNNRSRDMYRGSSEDNINGRGLDNIRGSPRGSSGSSKSRSGGSISADPGRKREKILSKDKINQNPNIHMDNRSTNQVRRRQLSKVNRTKQADEIYENINHRSNESLPIYKSDSSKPVSRSNTLRSHKDYLVHGVYEAQQTLEKNQHKIENTLYNQILEERNDLGEKILREVNEERSRMIGELQEWFSTNEIPIEERKSKLKMIKEYFEVEKGKRISALLRQLSLDEGAAVSRMIDSHSEQLLDIIAEKEDDIGYHDNNDNNNVTSLPTTTDEDEDLYSLVDRNEMYAPYDEIAYEKLDDNIESFTSLVKELCKKCDNQIQKLRSIFTWITNKNLNELRLNAMASSDTPVGLLRGVQMGTETYHQMLKRLCSYAGLKVEIIDGYSKGAGYRPGKRFRGSKYRNQWSAVLADGKWRFVNANWGSRHITESSVGEKTQTSPIYACDEFYFLTSPRHHIYQHYPDDPYWQLLERPISLSDFESLPLLKSTFFTSRLDLIGPTNAIIKTDTDGCVKFTIGFVNTREINWPTIYARLVDNSSNNIIDDSLVLYRHDNTTTLSGSLYVPKPGYYYLEIYVKSKWQQGGDDLAAMFYLHCDKVSAENFNTKWPSCENGAIIYGRQGDGAILVSENSHHCPLVTTNANDITITMNVNVAVKIKHNLERWQDSNNEFVNCERLAFPVERTHNSIQYYIRIRSAGFYNLCIYAESPEISGLRLVYRYLIRFTENTKTKIEVLPKASTRCRFIRLLEPLNGYLLRRSRVQFTLLSMYALEITISLESEPGNWQHLNYIDNKIGKWSGIILTGTQEGKLIIYGRFDENTDKLIPFIEYNIVKQ